MAVEAHTLKGAVANVSAKQMVRLCRDMELASKRGARQEAFSLLEAVEDAWEHVRPSLEQLCWSVWPVNEQLIARRLRGGSVVAATAGFHRPMDTSVFLEL